MRKLGFQCTVLEARHRPGGRNWTVRARTPVEFVDGTRQIPAWEADSYFNAGPARLPSIHKTMLGYCHVLGVPLEVEVNTSRSSLLQCDRAFGGQPVEQRQAVNDTRGHTAELLAKCIHRHALDEDLTPEDQERMLAFLREYGDLKSDDKYYGSERAGALRLPGAGTDREQLREPLEMRALLDAGFWRGITFEETLDMQATMFQPVGGMDRIPYAFREAIGGHHPLRCSRERNPKEAERRSHLLFTTRHTEKHRGRLLRVRPSAEYSPNHPKRLRSARQAGHRLRAV